MNQQTRTGRLAVCLFLYVFVLWAALLLAQSLGGGLPDILANLTAALEHPFTIHWTERSLVSILICSAFYAAALCYVSANRGKTRNGAEHGSAAWGTPQQVNAMFAQKQNKLLTQSVRLGLDTHKHRRSLNVQLYKDSWETIPDNLDTILYLGGNESSTHKYISEALGKSTINTKPMGRARAVPVPGPPIFRPAAANCSRPMKYVLWTTAMLSCLSGGEAGAGFEIRFDEAPRRRPHPRRRRTALHPPSEEAQNLAPGQTFIHPGSRHRNGGN